MSAFCRATLARVFPNAFWGDEHNKQTLMHKVDLFIIERRFETLSLHEILQGFKVLGAPPPSFLSSPESGDEERKS